MKIYNIVKGQLITIWIFGLVFAFFSLILTSASENFAWLVIFIFIPFLLVFYTIGWNAHKKQLTKDREKIKENKILQD